ncbi:MAG: glycosyltransferase family 4 protein [Rhodanobacteraceae bacterium]|nr:glycosyltransferase family 4 protein [Rhodanobacteraceae bacterium]
MSIPSQPPHRVLYVVSLFPCWSETFIVREIEQLVARGVDVRILSLKPPSEPLVQARAAALMDRVIGPRGLLAELPTVVGESLRQPVGVLGSVLRLVGGLWSQPVALGKSLVALWRGLAALPSLRAFGPELIHAHWATYPSTVAWALARLLRLPFSFTCHAHDIFVEDHLLRRKLSDAALAVTISQYNVRYLAPWGAAALGERLQVIHCGVDFAELPEQIEGRMPRRIVSVGRLDPIKGFDVLVPALGQLRQRGVEFECTVIGEGPQRSQLEAQRAALGLEAALQLPGAQPQELVRAAIAQACVFVMPSVLTPEGNQDGIPVALMEAMASGAAVISTRVSGIPELIEHDVSGLLVPAGDETALADALQRLLTDADLRRRLGVAARARVKAEFDASTEAARLLTLFRKTVDKWRSGADAR